MKPVSTEFASLVQSFFLERMMQQKNASPRTIEAYRDTFRLLLGYAEQHLRKPASKFTVSDYNAALVLGFLDHLERQRDNSIRTRNARLAALRSFTQYMILQHPPAMYSAQQILAIPLKRFEKPMIGFLTKDEVESLLGAPDTSTWIGRRDRLILTVLYNTGARVSELIQIRVADVALQGAPSVRLHGKGRKQRTVPLWKETARLIRDWIEEQSLQPDQWLLPNRYGQAMTRANVSLRIDAAVSAARSQCPQLESKGVSPHQFRHSTAMHLLQSGVDITVIALWLGHESPTTTHGYVEADLSMKERALAAIRSPHTKRARFRATPSLLTFLDSL